MYANKIHNLDEMGTFLGTYNLRRLKEEEVENLKRPRRSKEFESVIKNLPKKTQYQSASLAKF